MEHINIGENLVILQINVEGSSTPNSEYLSRLAYEHKSDVIVVQETHINDGSEYNTRGCVGGYDTVAYLLSPIHGIATYVRTDIKDVKVLYLSKRDDIFCIVIKVAGITITNIYKPPNSSWPISIIPMQYLQHPAICIGDFNSHHMNWGYNTNDENGIYLKEWSEDMNLHLVFDAKDRASFFSARWRRGYNPDLCFVSRDDKDIPLQTGRKVLESFPRSQHRPIVVDIGTKIHFADSKQKPRWNFAKADWKKFTNLVDAGIRFVPCETKNYKRFIGIIKSAAKRSIPRGFRKKYIPGWTAEMEDLFKQYEEGNDSEISDKLLELLMAAKLTKWENLTSEMTFTHSSRKSWLLLRKLGEAAKPKKIEVEMEPNRIATFIRQNSTKIKGDRKTVRTIKSELRKIKSQLPENSELDRPFDLDELHEAVASTKAGKAAGLDGIYPEFLKNLGKRALTWLLKFLNQILKSSNVPSLLKRANIIAILKPHKDPLKLESYRPIALLSVVYKLIEKLINKRIDPLIDEPVPPEQAGFRTNRSSSEQVLALTSYIEAGFERMLKTSVVFVDLSSAYDTVWRMGFMLKFVKAVPSKRLTNLVNDMLSNRYFRVFATGSSSRYMKLNNGFAQGGVNSPKFFNLYTSDMPNTKSRKFPFADDLALTTQTETFKEAEIILNEDVKKMDEYYRYWRLYLNEQKTESSVFHLTNQLANKKLEVRLNNVTIPFNKEPTYLGNKLDRSLTYKPELESRSQKLKSRNNILRKLRGSNWGANADTLRTSALALVYSTAEYASPVWYRCAHVNKIDNQLNETMRIITGAVDPTPLPWLHVLSNIAPPKLRREKAAHKEWLKCTEHPDLVNLPIREDFLNPPPQRLVSRNPIWKDPIVQHHDYSIIDRWKEFWRDSPEFTNKSLINDPSHKVEGFALPRKEWRVLNRLRTGHGCCAQKMYLWKYIDSPYCDCDSSTIQSMDHIVRDCPLRKFNNGDIHSIHTATGEAINWITDLDLNL